MNAVLTPTKVVILTIAKTIVSIKNLEKIYTSKVEENKTNLEYLNGVLKVLTFFECDKSDIYYTASDYAYQINKTPDAAIGKAQKLYKDGKLEFRTLEEVLDELPD